MTDLELLVETCNRLSNRLSDMANDEKQFSVNLCIELEHLSWQTLRTADTLKELNYRFGV